MGTGEFADRSATYVITNDIDMSSIGIVAVPKTNFSGTLDGDFHTLINAKVYLLYTIQGTESAYATIKNMVIFNADIDSTKFPNAPSNSHAGVLGYQSRFANI